MPSYRGLKIIKSKSFSLDEGSQPRDLLRRRVRTAEFYLVPQFSHMERVLLYDEASDNWAPLTRAEIVSHALRGKQFNQANIPEADDVIEPGNILPINDPLAVGAARSALLLRPNIEHYMLALIIGRGGLEHLGATFWGQTEMSVFDDGQHGVWGMTYKCKFFVCLCMFFLCLNTYEYKNADGCACDHRSRARDCDQRAQHAPRLGRGIRRLQRR
jgi:hypothetical protein